MLIYPSSFVVYIALYCYIGITRDMKGIYIESFQLFREVKAYVSIQEEVQMWEKPIQKTHAFNCVREIRDSFTVDDDDVDVISANNSAKILECSTEGHITEQDVVLELTSQIVVGFAKMRESKIYGFVEIYGGKGGEQYAHCYLHLRVFKVSNMCSYTYFFSRNLSLSSNSGSSANDPFS